MAGPRVVRRVVPVVRLRPGRLRRAVRREAPAAAALREDEHVTWSGRAPPVDDGPGRVPAAAPGSAPDLDRGGRRARVGVPGGHAGPADGAGDHRRHARALRAVRRSCIRDAARAGRPRPRRRRSASTPTATSRTTSQEALRRLVPVRGVDDEQDRPRARVAADGARATTTPPRRSRRELRRQSAGGGRQDPVPARASSTTTDSCCSSRWARCRTTKIMRSIELLGTEVAPAVRAAVGANQAAPVTPVSRRRRRSARGP